MRLILEIVTGDRKGTKVWLQLGQRFEVGRSEAADVAMVSDGYMSGRHFAVQSSDRGWTIQDLQSSNGTYLNGERVVDSGLNSGDMIVAGQTRFSVVIEDAAATLAEPIREVPGKAPDTSPPPPHKRRVDLTLTEAELARFRPVPGSGGGSSSKAELNQGQESGSGSPASNPPGAQVPKKENGVRSGHESRRATIQYTQHPFQKAIKDPHPVILQEALLAAVCSRQPWLYEICCEAASEPVGAQWELLYMFSILAQPSELKLMTDLGQTESLGAKRFRLLGVHGHPLVVPILLVGLESGAQLTRIAAGKAFSKISGQSLESPLEIDLDEVEPGDEYEQELLDEGVLPDAELATEFWHRNEERFSQGIRWCHGHDISTLPSREVLETLDLESRREVCLRGMYYGEWDGSVREFEIFDRI